MQSNKRTYKAYDHSPYTADPHKATDSTGIKSSDWQVVLLSNQLESVNNILVGNRGSERISDHFKQPSVQDHWPTPTH